MAKSTKSCGPELTSRIDVFREVAVDKMTNAVNSEIFESIAEDQYDEFIRFCEQCAAEKDNIKDVSCALENGKLDFSINYK